MAVTNNVDSNVQNQLIEEQIRQQQVQQNQPTETNNQTNGVATAVATAPAVQPEPLVPSTETAKVQELIVGGNAIKADLNDKVIIVASTGQTPPVDAPKGDSVIGKLTPPATLQNPESPDYNPDSLSNVGAKRANNTPFHELNMTADEVIQYAMQNGNSGQSGRVSDGIVEGIRNQNKDIGFISDVFQKLGAKGTAAVISETGYLGAGNYIDYPKGDGDPIIKDGKVQTYSPTAALESLRAAGKFNEGDMYQLAKTALETPTAYRDGKTQSELLNENITKERAGELDGNSTWAKKGLLGVTNYTTTGISNLDKAFQNASPQLKEMWEKGLGAAIDDKLAPKTQIIAGNPQGVENSLELLFKSKSSQDGAILLEAAVNNTGSSNNEIPRQRELVKSLIAAGADKTGGNDSYYNIKVSLGALATDKGRFEKFTEKLLKASIETLSMNQNQGVALGTLMGGLAHPGDNIFASKAIDVVHDIRQFKQPLQKAGLSAILDAAITSTNVGNFSPDILKKLNNDDYKDLASLGLSLPPLLNRLIAKPEYDKTTSEVFLGLSNHAKDASSEVQNKLIEIFNSKSGEILKRLRDPEPGAGDKAAESLSGLFNYAMGENRLSSMKKGISEIIGNSIKDAEKFPETSGKGLNRFVASMQTAADIYKDDYDKMKSAWANGWAAAIGTAAAVAQIPVDVPTIVNATVEIGLDKLNANKNNMAEALAETTRKQIHFLMDEAVDNGQLQSDSRKTMTIFFRLPNKYFFN
jgi:hypothetical protein